MTVARPRTPPPAVDRRVDAAQGALGFCVGALGAVLVLLARDLGVATARLSWLSSAFGTGLLVLGIAGQWLLRWGALRTLRLGAMLLGLGALVLGHALDRDLALVGGGLVGGGGALVVLATPALLTGVSAAARLARATAVSSSSGVLGPLVVGAVDRVTGRGRVGLLVAVGLAVAALLPAGSTDRPPERRGARPLAGDPTPRPDEQSFAMVVWSWLRLTAAVAAEFCFVVWAVSRLHMASFDAAAAATAGAAFPVGMVAGRFLVAGRASTRGTVPLAVVTAAAGTAGVVSQAPGGIVVLALFLAGLGIAPLYPVLLAELVDVLAPAVHRGATLGALASGVAIVLGPQAFTMISSQLGQRIAFLLVLPLLLPVLVPWVPHPDWRQAE